MAGAGYKLFNTGDVLTAAQVNTYLMEQTVMVFADAAARTAALSGVVSEGMISYLKDTNAVEVYNGSAWVASDDPNAIQNTIVDAKGDLITATAADTPARLAVGNNGETLVADSSASTGLRWQGDFAAGKNKVINGDFGIWQRGTSFSNPANGDYLADRFRTIHDGTGATRTISRQTFTPGTAPVAGYEGQYFFRYAISAAGTGNNYQGIYTPIEDVRTLAGQTITISFWAKANTNLTVNYEAVQYFGVGGSSDVYMSGSPSANLTTSWQRFSFTGSLPSISGKTIGSNSFLRIGFFVPANATSTVDFWGIQVEAGNVATAFQTATGTLAGELAACQRYYQRFNFTANGVPIATMAQWSTTNGSGLIFLPVSMRVVPTSLDYSGIQFDRPGAGVVATTSVTIGSTNSGNTQVFLGATAASGLTAGTFGYISATTSTSYIGFSAEL